MCTDDRRASDAEGGIECSLMNICKCVTPNIADSSDTPSITQIDDMTHVMGGSAYSSCGPSIAPIAEMAPVETDSAYGSCEPV